VGGGGGGAISRLSLVSMARHRDLAIILAHTQFNHRAPAGPAFNEENSERL
jgi:hypothetical protein